MTKSFEVNFLKQSWEVAVVSGLNFYRPELDNLTIIPQTLTTVRQMHLIKNYSLLSTSYVHIVNLDYHDYIFKASWSFVSFWQINKLKRVFKCIRECYILKKSSLLIGSQYTLLLALRIYDRVFHDDEINK